jgi:hypothetical protein
MTGDEVRQVLARITTYDGRQIEASTILAWGEVLADVSYDDAVRAVTEHYASSHDWLMPVHIVAAASRYEDDRAREARKLIEYGAQGEGDVVVKPPFYDAMERAAQGAVDACIAKGLGREDRVTKESAFLAARDVRDAWEVEHGTWKRRQWDYDEDKEPF